MHRHFEEELSELKKDILCMGSLTEQAIMKAVLALRDLDVAQARFVIDQDRVIDEQELRLEERCFSFLALRQPLAADLRFVTMAMKIISELERMADLAVDIAQRVVELSDQPLLKPLIDIPKLTLVAQEMTDNVIRAFVDQDPATARRIILMDEQADQLCNLVHQELIYDYMAKDPRTASRAVPLLLVARHLERICDHATNIAEDIIFMTSAMVVKHHPEKLQNEENLSV